MANTDKIAHNEALDFNVIKKRFGIHLLVLLFVLGGFCITAIGTVTSYNAKTKLLSILSDMRILRTEALTEKLRYLYTFETTSERTIIEEYSRMYDSYTEAVNLDSTFSENIFRLRIMTSEERRVFTALSALIQYRGFDGESGEYINFLKMDDDLRELFKLMLHKPGEPIEKNPLVDLHYDFSAALAEADKAFALYSHFVLENASSALLNEKASSVTRAIDDIISHLPAQASNQRLRDTVENLLLNKTQVFARITSYDTKIMQFIRTLHESENGVSALLENVYADLQADLRFVRHASFILIGLFFSFILAVVSTFLIMINKSAQYTLRRDMRIAELANKAKDSFLANISHEIRSPLNAVLGLDELIIRESTEPQILDYALNIQRSGKTLLNLISDVLDFSKIEAGKIEILPVEYDITSVVGDLYNMILPRAAAKNLKFIVQIAEDLPQLLIGDEVRIKQCVLNILTNAVKYTKEGSVTFEVDWQKCEDVPDTIVLTVFVSDTGIGIKEEDMPKLFKAFERIEERRNRTIEGTGLGMAIVNNLLSLMGTSLDVKSVYGKGSVFSFGVRQQVADWTPVGSAASEAYKKPLARADHGVESFTAPEARILVVDDTAINLTVVRGLLKPTLIQVDTALSGHEALKLVTENRYDLIFLDHRMPVMDGIETLRFMQTLDANLNKDVPIIALTANAVSGAREMYLREGFSDYMSKPIDITRLEKMLKAYLPQNAVQVVELSDEEGSESDAEYEKQLLLALLKKADGIDVEVALANCGGAEVLKSVLVEYYNAIRDRSALIEQYASIGDWKNYTICVHALKSTSRLIGALSLSEFALQMEDYGDKAQEGDKAAIEAITKQTAALLAQYRSYRNKLEPFVSSVDAESRTGQNDSEKPLLDADAYQNALSSLRECMQVSDFTLADQIIEMLDGYRINEPFKSMYKKVKAAVTAVDPARVLAAIDAALT